MIATTIMISGKYKQFLFENDACIRLIEFIKQENTFFKTRLSEVINQIHDKKGLEQAEIFHNQFIIKDDLLDHVIYDLKKESDKWRNLKLKFSDTSFSDLVKIHNHLKDQVSLIERDYMLVKSDYNTYLSSLLISDL